MYNVGDNIGGKYVILDELKRGAFGFVYKVRNYGINRESVIKLVPAKNPGNLREIIESNSQGICQHKNIVKIYACEVADVTLLDGSAGRGILMELEWISDGSWGAALSAGYMPIAQSCSLAIDTLFGLHYAHQHGVIHGDVKPDNVFMAGANAKLADFGLSKLSTLPGTNRASSLHYAPHASPELRLSGNIDVQTDVFAAGVTLFRSVNNISDWGDRLDAMPKLEEYLLTGSLIQRIGYNPEVPRKVRTVINRACNPDLASRFGNCAEFRQALSGIRFKNSWARVDVDRYESIVGGRSETVEMYVSGRNFEVAYKVNDRRKAPLCAKFTTRKEAHDYQMKLLYENTVE